MKRFIWTLCMATIGFFLGLKTQGAGINVRELAVSTLWAGLIGFGFGSIFSQRLAGSRLVIYWAGTLGLVAAFFGPLLRVTSFLVQESLAALIGILMGVLIGTVQLKAARRVSRASNLPAEPRQRGLDQI